MRHCCLGSAIRCALAALPLLIDPGLASAAGDDLTGAAGDKKSTPVAASTPGPASASEEVTCRPDTASREARVTCSNGMAWTMRSAGLVLPPVLRCDSQHPECCRLGFQEPREQQLQELLRFGQGQPPVCYMRVRDFLSNPPSQAGAADAESPKLKAVEQLAKALPEKTAPPAAPTATLAEKSCPKGQLPAAGGCHDPKALLAALLPPKLRDPNRVLVPEAAEVIDKMRRELDRTGRCPESALDIDVLKRIYYAAQLRTELLEGVPLDVSPLLARAQSPTGNHPEAGLPISCGHNATFGTWYRTSFHCASQGMCFAQSHATLPHTCVRFDRAGQVEKQSPYFWPQTNCQSIPSCAAVQSGQCTGIARLTALGQGVFLMIQEDTKGTPYYYGVLFGRTPTRTASEKKEAERARTLLREMLTAVSDAAEQKRLKAMLDAAAD